MEQLFHKIIPTFSEQDQIYWKYNLLVEIRGRQDCNIYVYQEGIPILTPWFPYNFSSHPLISILIFLILSLQL